MKVARGMVFGVFDGLHEGHRYFLREAASGCDKLIVVVARDTAARALKKRSPKNDLALRMVSLRATDPSLTVVPGDEKEGEWSVLKENRPDRIFLGYDQTALFTALSASGIPLTFLGSYKKDTHKSSIINGTATR